MTNSPDRCSAGSESDNPYPEALRLIRRHMQPGDTIGKMFLRVAKELEENMSISDTAKRAHHAFQRESLQEPISIQGVWLDANQGRIRVRVEVGGVWRNILDLPNIPDGGHISHIVNPSGILASPIASELG